MTEFYYAVDLSECGEYHIVTMYGPDGAVTFNMTEDQSNEFEKIATNYDVAVNKLCERVVANATK